MESSQLPFTKHNPVKTGLPTNGSENPGVQANLMALFGFSVTPPNVNMEPPKMGVWKIIFLVN